ncbi:MAG: enoyl-CoA hydratase/isomerase family protein [Deltaproteobacteria bacterium]|nr:enoyl-CoA hydratase/isomerase family protein [Deltaproteobacteria bacterium]MBW2052698.1 enoyl-CoA hydratase/isomerase family protein [Deltaproteobacteria bacterium]MBW2140915.1 enoyl-CoA hydratase/isomerase family protein [Deltaproteobacteria bacterium]MBW2323999.1 enoyl-CoA hydratase/isomerase family protein [Deltaproteobacteria bacterium]
MAKVEYELDEHVALVTMNSGENRFNFPFFKAFLEVLDKIEHDTDANVLVVKSSHEKIWSNGIDLDWFLPAVEKEGPELRNKFLVEMFGFMKRVLTFPGLTIAAITGHAFAGGAFLSFAHDFRFMRSDRGWLCMPEVNIGMTLGPVFSAISRRALPMYLFEEMQYTGIRLTAQECVEHHIVKKACHIDDLMDETLAFAKTLNKDKELIRKMKIETHQETLAVIDETISSLSG